MNAITKLAAAALGALSIAGGVAVAQDASTSKDAYAHPDTANYGTPPGAPLKRDGSLRADPTPVATGSAMTSDTSSSTTTVAAPAAADTSTADTSTPVADASPAPRADRN